MEIDLNPYKGVYLLTVPGAYTTSTRALLDQAGISYRQTHFQQIPEVWIEKILDDFNLITTYRNPYEVGATWANRRKLDPQAMRQWKSNWVRWGIMVKAAAKVVEHSDLTEHLNRNPHGDKTGAFAAYEAGDFESYYQIVPKHLIDLACKISVAAGLY